MSHRPVHSPASPDTPSLCLALGVHDHQPIGNFEHVYRSHLEGAYRPFLDAMAAHVSLPFSLHTSGPLLEWLVREAPDCLEQLRRMIARGQVEVKGGAFYEAILTMIPDADKAAQLELMDRFLGEHLGAHPTGAWLAERVWEPHLPLSLASAGLEYAVLDDSHFVSAGMQPGSALGYYVTEDQGRRFDLFPISKDLRYLIPFHEPEEILGYLRRLACAEQTEGGAPTGGKAPIAPPLAVYEDDGEKFGGWPKTRDHVYRDGWLERFLTALEAAVADGWLNVLTLSEYRRRYEPLGRVYLPAGSYAEMLEWSGGYYRNFLVRYPEANRMHKRMLMLSERTRSCTGDAAASDSAHLHVLRAQCNDAYWHGVFGGLYLPHLRHAVYTELLSAERALPRSARPVTESLDFDLDGREEIFLRSPDLTAILTPHGGGALLALDHLPTAYALFDTLARRREPEHAALEALATSSVPTGGGETGVAGDYSEPQSIHETLRMKEPGLERMLFHDPLPRTSFLDHFYDTEVDWHQMQECRAKDHGDFANADYAVVPSALESGRASSRAMAGLHRRGRVGTLAADLAKTVALPARPGLLEVTYAISLEQPDNSSAAEGSDAPDSGPPPHVVAFSPEITINLLAGWALDRYVLIDGQRPDDPLLAAGGSHPRATEVTLVDEPARLALTMRWFASSNGAALPATLHRYGVVTVSLSEDGFERIYQGTALVPSWALTLEPGERLDVRIELEVTSV
jgi:4-alpha-glucanotransferase